VAISALTFARTKSIVTNIK